MKRAAERAGALLLLTASACSGAPPQPAKNVQAAPPPKDDGKPSQGGAGGAEHAAALEQLRSAKISIATDKQNSVRVPLPDAEHWTRVKFWGVESLVGFRYGRDHHALVGVFVTHVPDNTEPSACTKTFEAWAQPFVDAFEVSLKHASPIALVWKDAIVEVEAVDAQTATLADRDEYRSAYAVYPAWNNACVVVGVAVPSRGESERAGDVRDRFVKEVFPKLDVVAKDEPKGRF